MMMMNINIEIDTYLLDNGANAGNAAALNIA